MFNLWMGFKRKDGESMWLRGRGTEVFEKWGL
jgi:hypothetical protein